MGNLYLAHYGIAGQKWGVRRYQNKDGTLTSLGKKHYSSDEIASDNHDAFEKGRNATLAGRTLKYANKLNDYNRRQLSNATIGNLAKRTKNYERSSRVVEKAQEEYETRLKEAMDHADSLVKKYGESNVKDLVYKTLPDGSKIVNEQVYTGKQKALGALTFVVAALPLGTAWMFPLVPMPAGVKGTYNAGKMYYNTK